MNPFLDKDELNHIYSKPDIKLLSPRLEDVLIPLVNMYPKLILGGSSALWMLGILNRMPNDLDFSLTERLTEEEFITIRDFFELDVNHEVKDYQWSDEEDDVIEVKYTTSELLERDLVQFKKYKDKESKGTLHYKIDIFNNKCITKNNIMRIEYNDILLNVVHPSYIIAAKSKYAFDPKVGASHKHMEDLKSIMAEDNLKKYFNELKRQDWLEVKRKRKSEKQFDSLFS